ncbi:protein CHROMATIN REMODELING 24 [Pelomyxa schiedti]|nr:protein CHROMATIN REMODELING 24 [Pelomyxa schiedti]
MRCLFALLENQVPLGHRFLIFSQSVRMLDIIEKELIAKDYKLCRIDGRMTSTSERQAVINEFNSDTEINCFLLTTQVGGLGINLTSADRVCIVDPSWSTIDNQAVDRVYRIGQTKDVVIYRFMTCGSIEEKIYRKQVFKESLLRMTFQDKNQYRYFSAQELRELFTFDDPTFSTTQQQLAALHSNRVSYPELDEHLAFLQSLPVVAGLSDHDLLFTKEAIDNPNCAEEEINSLISEAEQTLKVKSSPSRGKLITSTTNKKKDSVNRKLSFSSDEELAVSTPTVAQHNHSVIIISSDEDAEASATPVPGTVAEVPVDLTEPDNEAPTPTPVDLTEPDDEAPLPPSLPDEVEQGTTTSPSSEKAQPVAPDTEPRVTPTPPPSHVCETHLRECYPIAPQHCRCFLSPENLEAYNSFMAKSSIERGGKDELKWLLAALELCDDDLQLHKRAAYLGFLLGF